MRVGTDGVLLGAWANVAHAKTILDIGCGTGLLALMLAQRNALAQITAIEIEPNAAEEADFNTQNSPWENRIQVQYIGIAEFASTATQKFGCIVCNPPFFENASQARTTARTTARHNTELTYELLFAKAAQLLAANGQFTVIIPTQFKKKLEKLADLHKLHLQRTCLVHTLPGKVSKRILLQFGFTEMPIITENITISKPNGKYTPEMWELTSAFYL